jgi:hypothetical protein
MRALVSVPLHNVTEHVEQSEIDVSLTLVDVVMVIQYEIQKHVLRLHQGKEDGVCYKVACKKKIEQILWGKNLAFAVCSEYMPPVFVWHMRSFK